MQIVTQKRSINTRLSISHRKQSLSRTKRNHARPGTPKVGVSRFPSIDLSFFNKRELVLDNELDIKALEVLKSIIPTDETIPDKQLNDIISSIKQTDYYEVSRGLTEDGNPAILLPVCYKTFQYGLGLALWNQFDKAEGNNIDTKAIFAFCALVIRNFNYTFEDYHGSEMKRDMLKEMLMNNLDDDEAENCNEQLRLMDDVDVIEAKINKFKLPVHKSTYERWINASSFKKSIKKSFIAVWDIHWNSEQYGTYDTYENGYYNPSYSTIIFPNQRLFEEMSNDQNMYQEEGVCDYVYEWIITCKKDLKNIDYEDKPLKQFFKWYDTLTEKL